MVSRAGDLMSDGLPTPSTFDGMAAFDGPNGTTILMRNHENKSRIQPNGQHVGPTDEIPVEVPEGLRYNKTTTHPSGIRVYNGGVTKVVTRGRKIVKDFGVLGGTLFNCAGGQTPWGTWITCEEQFQSFTAADGSRVRHGYVFEVSAHTDGPIEAVAIRRAGRFEHEAVAWLDGHLYETEDNNQLNALNRYDPRAEIRSSGDLAASDGVLEALRIPELENPDTSVGRPVGTRVRHRLGTGGKSRSGDERPRPQRAGAPAWDSFSSVEGGRGTVPSNGGLLGSRRQGLLRLHGRRSRFFRSDLGAGPLE